ncbi:MAG TPA: CHAD domain-containing protein [Nitrosospira sp.]|nr:CHAD domain-containing protein [Nitrosospira sp.]
MKGQIRQFKPVNPVYGLLHKTIDEALEQLDATRPILDESIHNARKSMKNSRAELRLLREGMPGVAYQTENTRLRDAGRALSPIRDARSVIDAFNSLRNNFAKELEGVDVAPLEEILHSKLAKARSQLQLDMPDQSAQLQNCNHLLEDCLSLAKKEHFSSIDSVVIHSGVQRIYRKGRNAFAQAKAERTTEVLHECRKQAKYLFNGLNVLVIATPNGNSKALKHARRLAERLGDDHELAMLSEQISADDYVSVNAETIKVFRKLIEQRRAKLQNDSLKVGEKLYQQKPREFTKKVMQDVVLPSRNLRQI